VNPLAEELNATIGSANPALLTTLSALGRELFFPKGILTQTAEAREKAYRFDATIGIARAGGEAMNLPAVTSGLAGISPDEALDYAPSTGNPGLRRKWQADMMAKNPSLEGKPTSLPVVTGGITHGLSLCGELFLDPGDVVLLPDKYWGNYRMVFGTRREAEVRTFPFFSADAGFNIDGACEALSGVLDERGKAFLVLNFPNNPTGYSIRRAEARAMAEVLDSLAGPGRDLVVVLDDAYFGLFYDDDACPESLFGLIAGMNEHLFPIKLDGATKEEYAWGLRVGFITFGVAAAGREAEVHQALEKKVGGAVRGGISNCSQLGQTLVLRALDDPDFHAQKNDRFELMKKRALAVKKALANEEYDRFWEPYPFNAGYFMCVRLKSLDAEEFRVRLLERHGVGVIADGGTDIRVAFSCLEVDEIPELFAIMFACAEEMTSLS
jgi:aspartate/methionine/tyrosine aminotransferase